MTNKEWTLFIHWINLCKENNYLWPSMEKDLRELAISGIYKDRPKNTKPPRLAKKRSALL
jgi:hypothetical protein